jgi:hypothetical protein
VFVNIFLISYVTVRLAFCMLELSFVSNTVIE